MRGSCYLGVPTIAVFKANLDNHAFIYFICRFYFYLDPTRAFHRKSLHHYAARIGTQCKSLWIAEQFFTAPDYEVHRLAYPSTKKDLDQLGEQIRREAQGLCSTTPNFLTHSMGGIILRVIKSTHPDFAVARVVMLGPPNDGSEIVDEWGDWKLFVKLNGPAGARLGRDG